MHVREQALRRPSPGLCASCVHAQVVASSKGSRFYLCRLAHSDSRFPRYPPLPVLACVGHVTHTAAQTNGD